MNSQLFKALEICMGIITLFFGLSMSLQIYKATERLIDKMVVYEQFNYEYASKDMIVDPKNSAEKSDIYYTLLRGGVNEIVIDGATVETYQELVKVYEPYDARNMIRDTVNGLNKSTFNVLYYYNKKGFIKKIVYE